MRTIIIIIYLLLCFLFKSYTNADNPFGDEHLLDTFVWRKKLDKQGIKKDIPQKDLEKLQKRKMIENKVM